MTGGNKASLPGWLCAAVVVLAMLLAGCGEQRFTPLQAQEFNLPELGGEAEISLADYRGEVVYLTFWASWCIPCRQEMPYLAQLWQRHREAGFQVIGINEDEDLAAAGKFAAELKIPFPLVTDPGREISKRYRVPGFPTHYIVDRRGRIRFSGIGFNLADVAAVTQEVETLLAESADAAD